MYRTGLNSRDRAMTLGAVVLVHLGMAFALLNLSGSVQIDGEEVIPQLINVNNEEPEPPLVEMVQDDAAPEEEGAASAENIRSEATPVEAPKPKVEVPTPNPITASPTPNSGSDATQGASDRPGPGTGAGGVGDGTGAGRGGDGTGGGGQGTGVRLLRPLVGQDYPDGVSRRWPRGGQIFVRLRIEPDGSVSQCDIMRSFGDRLADQWTCSLLRNSRRFEPARDGRGRPIAAWFGYVQRDTGTFY